MLADPRGTIGNEPFFSLSAIRDASCLLLRRRASVSNPFLKMYNFVPLLYQMSVRRLPKLLLQMGVWGRNWWETRPTKVRNYRGRCPQIVATRTKIVFVAVEVNEWTHLL